MRKKTLRHPDSTKTSNTALIPLSHSLKGVSTNANDHVYLRDTNLLSILPHYIKVGIRFLEPTAWYPQLATQLVSIYIQTLTKRFRNLGSISQLHTA